MANNRRGRPRINYGPRRLFDGIEMRSVTVLIDDFRTGELQALRTRCAGMDDATFWPILIEDGAHLLAYQLDQEDGLTHPERGRALSDVPGVPLAVVIPVEEGQLRELQRLRARRPEWDDALFWQQALDWGTCLLAQILDREDGVEPPSEYDPDDEIPF